MNTQNVTLLPSNAAVEGAVSNILNPSHVILLPSPFAGCDWVLISRAAIVPSLSILHIFKPLMCQCLTCRDSLLGIKVGHGTNRIFKIFVDALPKGERSARVVFVETITSDLENGDPRIVVANMVKEPTHSSAKYEIWRSITTAKGSPSLVQLVFPNGKDDAFVHRVNALHDIKRKR